jgi:hypothetical protein
MWVIGEKNIHQTSRSLRNLPMDHSRHTSTRDDVDDVTTFRPIEMTSNASGPTWHGCHGDLGDLLWNRSSMLTCQMVQ